MRTIKSIALALALLTGTLVSANTEPTTENTNPVCKQIGQLLENPQFKVEDEISAYVTFMLNDDSEIIVIIRSKSNPATGETSVLSNPSPQLLTQLRRHNAGQAEAYATQARDTRGSRGPAPQGTVIRAQSN